MPHDERSTTSATDAGQVRPDAVRQFTLAEANRTLPLVRRIVADIRETHAAWRDLVREYEIETARHDADWSVSDAAEMLRKRIEGLSHVIDDYLAELGPIGCLFKGFEQSTVDFYGRLEERDVFWCWSYDEPEIRNWHELDAGFAGRQPIPDGVDG